jgi:hypothetical protein
MPYKFNLKITSFIWNYLLAIIYLLEKLLFLIFLRWMILGRELNLIYLKNNIVTLYFIALTDKLFSILILIFCITLFLLFLKLNKILRYNLRKVWFYEENLNTIFTKPRSLVYYTNKFNDHYSYQKFYQILFSWLKKKCIIDVYTKPPSVSSQKQLQIPLFLVLPILIIIESYFFNWTLKYTFYYLFFYVIFNYWVIISEILPKHFGTNARIVFEIFYKNPDIIYVNITDYDKKHIIFPYIKNYNAGITLDFVLDYLIPFSNTKQFYRRKSKLFPTYYVNSFEEIIYKKDLKCKKFLGSYIYETK